MILPNGTQQSPIVNKRSNRTRIDKKRTLPRSLKCKIKLKPFVTHRTAKSVHQARFRRKPNMDGILDRNLSVVIHVSVTNISRHIVPRLFGRTVNLLLTLKKPFRNVSHHLRDIMSHFPLPRGFVRCLFYLPINRFVVCRRGIQYKPEIIRKSMLHLSGKIETTRAYRPDIGIRVKS